MEGEEGHAGHWVRHRHLAGVDNGVEVCLGHAGKGLCVCWEEQQGKGEGVRGGR